MSLLLTQKWNGLSRVLNKPLAKGALHSLRLSLLLLLCCPCPGRIVRSITARIARIVVIVTFWTGRMTLAVPSPVLLSGFKLLCVQQLMMAQGPLSVGRAYQTPLFEDRGRQFPSFLFRGV